MTKSRLPLLCVLAAMLVGLTLIGAADSTASIGRVVGWGAGGPRAHASDVAAGFDFSCAIDAGSGVVDCWGPDESGQATPPDAVNGVAGSATQI